MILILLIPGVVSAADKPISLYIDNKKIDCDVPPEIINGRTLVPARVIFEHFDADVYWNDSLKQATIATDSKTIILTINSNTAMVNSKRYVLDTAPVIKDGRTLIPVRFVSEAMGHEVNWDDKTRSVKIKTKTPEPEKKPEKEPEKAPEKEFKYKITNISTSQSDTNALVTVTTDCTEKPYMMILAAPYRIVFDFEDARLEKGDGKIAVNSGYIKEIRYAQHETSARVVIECNGTQPYKATYLKGVTKVEVGDKDSYIEESDEKLPIDDEENEENNQENTPSDKDDTTPPSSGDNNNPSDDDTEEDKPMDPLEALKFLASRDPDNLLVVLDAGHGGKDPGALGSDQEGNIILKEKDANLTIANKVAAILKERGIKYKQTRSTDVYLALQEITDYANRLDADLFVSVHNNAVENTEISGTMVLYNSDGTDTYGIDSKTIATFIKNEVVNNVDITDRGIVSRPGLWVLRKTKMPAVLIECAFVTNEYDRSLLMDEDVLDMYALSIADGIEKSLEVMKENIIKARETLATVGNDIESYDF